MNRILTFFLVILGLILSISYLDFDLKSIASPAKLSWPLEKGSKREKKLTFGLFVTPNPEQNPIDPPERFIGYHTALDLEIFADEHQKDVPVYAACDGKLLAAQEAEGYGGVLVQSCTIDDQDITVLYGHMDFHTFKVKVGDEVKARDQLGVLGEEESEESGFTRKHLHFAVHKGKEIALLGYVQKESDLANYLDPLPLLGGH